MNSPGGPLRARWTLAWALLLGALGLALALALARSPLQPRADFVLNSGGEVSSLDPQAAAGAAEGQLARLLFEPLLTKEPPPRIVGGVAESWDSSPDGLSVTFYLRADARWSNGDPVTAQDFAWSFRRILSPETAAQNAALLYCIAGAREFHTGVAADGTPAERSWGRVGVQALSPSELKITLEQPTPEFMELMAFYAFSPVHRSSIAAIAKRFPDTWQREWMRPEHLVCNGPFTIIERRINDRIRLRRNPHYWDRDRVAFRTIDVLAVERAGTALNLFLTGDIDWLDGTVPPSLIDELVDREDFHSTSYLASYFYRINTTVPPYDDPLVRTALSLAIDRQTICSKILKAGQTPAVAFIPRGRMGGYHSPSIVRFDLEAARASMERAGYWGADSKPFPTLELHFNESEAHRDIAEFIAEGWRRTFDIRVQLRSTEFRTHLEQQKQLEYTISRSSWIADTGDVGSFLNIWVSGSVNNRTGWSNAEFDELMERARNELGPKRRSSIYKQAERILLEDAPLLPIYDYVSQNLVNPRLGGMTNNLLNEHFPKTWFWKSNQELVQDRAALPTHKIEAYENAERAPGPARGLYSKQVQEERAAALALKALQAQEAQNASGTTATELAEEQQ